MSSRPRRSAAQRATEAITDLADRDNDRSMSSSRSARRSGGVASVTRGPPSSPIAGSSPATGDSGNHIHLMVKNLPSSKLRQATAGGSSSKPDSSENGKRLARGGKKKYVVESDSEEEDEDDDEEAEADEDEEVGGEIEVGDRAGLLDDDEMEDAESDDDDVDMDMDADGDDDDDADEDADGDMDVDMQPTPAVKTGKASGMPTKSRNPPPAKPVSKTAIVAGKLLPQNNDDDDDDLSELDSEPEANETAKVRGVMGGDEDAEGEDEDVDAEGEEIDVIDEDGRAGEELVSDDGSVRTGTPNLERMTARQRTKLGDGSDALMKLTDDPTKRNKLTAEEISMRRAEMARRRRNLSEKRNEEVKMETINKLLKKQAPKTNRKTALMAGDEMPDMDGLKANPTLVRWVNNKHGSVVAIPEVMLTGPAGRVFSVGGAVVGIDHGSIVERAQ